MLSTLSRFKVLLFFFFTSVIKVPKQLLNAEVGGKKNKKGKITYRITHRGSDGLGQYIESNAYPICYPLEEGWKHLFLHEEGCIRLKTSSKQICFHLKKKSRSSSLFSKNGSSDVTFLTEMCKEMLKFVEDPLRSWTQGFTIYSCSYRKRFLYCFLSHLTDLFESKTIYMRFTPLHFSIIVFLLWHLSLNKSGEISIQLYSFISTELPVLCVSLLCAAVLIF